MDIPEIAVRWLHILAGGGMLGGALLVAFVASRDPAAARAVARPYERAFWLFAGLSVITGIGNTLRSFADFGSPLWTEVYALKFGFATMGLIASVGRTLLIARPHPVPKAWLVGAYTATAAGLATVVVLAEVLAHGI
ncbi:MAG: hypothetical protein ACYDDF_01620 [Thermoplasmatota archaeon]